MSLAPHDHRALAARLDLYHIEEESPGFIYWHPKGWSLYLALESFIRHHMRRAGYEEVRSPALLPKAHWERSGHWEKFGANMFALPEHALALKPMSCPGHVAIFNSQPRSYRDLPKRYCEFGAVYRNESSGSLLGLLRSRAFEQDDAHVFCLPDQVLEEVGRFCRLLSNLYAALGFEDVDVALSLRPAVRAGSDSDWDWSENTLLHAAQAAGLNPRLLPGEGAFYGPKLEFALRDNQGRSWQCGTIQLDCILPKRLGAVYKNDQGHLVEPIMIHHAILGSMGRFIGILLEHHQGRLPAWLLPHAVAILPISEGQLGPARALLDHLQAHDLRAALYDENETLSRRLVMVHDHLIPYQVVIGKREAEAGRYLLQTQHQKQLLDLEGLVATLRAASAMPNVQHAIA
jgi:threonyl-tRNA synthetase